jgi:hypothetical protein
LNLGPDFVVLHKLPTISGRQANIHRLDEADVVLQISAQNLLRQFVGFQASLGRDLGKLRFLFGLQTYFHRFSLGRFATAVKPSPQSSACGGIYTFDADDRLAGEKIYYDRGTVLRQLGVFHEPPSVLGQLGILATHPITIARALTKGRTHR